MSSTPALEQRPDLRGILLFNALYMSVAIAAALYRQSGEFLFYIVTLFVIAAVLYFVHKRVNLTKGTLWCLSLWGLAHMAGGLVPLPETWPYNPPHAVLYSWWLIPDLLKYDQVVHAYGFGVCTWVCWQGMQASTGVQRATFGRLALCALAAVGLGALNEVIEFVATLVFAETNVGGYRNTGWDLVSNLIGALAAALILWRKASASPVA